MVRGGAGESESDVGGGRKSEVVSRRQIIEYVEDTITFRVIEFRDEF